MADTAVVILNYNGVSFLKQFLAGVVKHSHEGEVIVADNCSTDDSINYLKNEHPEVKLIQLEKNYGFTGGYNRILDELPHKYCVLLNSDIEVTPGWLAPLVSFMKCNEDVAACQPLIKDFKNKAYFEYAGAAGGFLDAFGFPYCRGRIFETLEKDEGQYKSNLEVFWASGACMMVRVEDYRESGGLDEEFFAHMEEIDLCWRLQAAGKKIYCVASSTVYHVGGGTLSKSNPRKTYLNFRNNLSMMLKNEPPITLLFKLPIKIMLDWAAALKFWKENSIEHFTAVFRAHFHSLIALPSNLEKRKLIKRKTVIPLKKRKPILVAWQYFLLNRTKYSQLKR